MSFFKNNNSSNKVNKILYTILGIIAIFALIIAAIFGGVEAALLVLYAILFMILIVLVCMLPDIIPELIRTISLNIRIRKNKKSNTGVKPANINTYHTDNRSPNTVLNNWHIRVEKGYREVVQGVCRSCDSSSSYRPLEKADLIVKDGVVIGVQYGRKSFPLKDGILIYESIDSRTFSPTGHEEYAQREYLEKKQEHSTSETIKAEKEDKANVVDFQKLLNEWQIEAERKKNEQKNDALRKEKENLCKEIDFFEEEKIHNPRKAIEEELFIFDDKAGRFSEFADKFRELCYYKLYHQSEFIQNTYKVRVWSEDNSDGSLESLKITAELIETKAQNASNYIGATWNFKFFYFTKESIDELISGIKGKCFDFPIVRLEEKEYYYVPVYEDEQFSHFYFVTKRMFASFPLSTDCCEKELTKLAIKCLAEENTNHKIKIKMIDNWQYNLIIYLEKNQLFKIEGLKYDRNGYDVISLYKLIKAWDAKSVIGKEVFSLFGKWSQVGYAIHGISDISDSFVTIPEVVTKIEGRAFKQAYIKNVALPKSLKCIGEEAFMDSYIYKIKIPQNVTYIGKNAFRCCTKLSDVELPNSITEIATGTFYYCKSLTKIIIPDSVKKIGDDAFGECEKLTIYASAGSEAENYAKEHNIYFCPCKPNTEQLKNTSVENVLEKWYYKEVTFDGESSTAVNQSLKKEDLIVKDISVIRIRYKNKEFPLEDGIMIYDDIKDSQALSTNENKIIACRVYLRKR